MKENADQKILTASVAIFLASALWGLYWIPIRKLDASGLSGTWSLMYINLLPSILLIPAICWSWLSPAKNSRAFQANKNGIRHALLIGLLTGLAMSLYGIGLIYSNVLRATLLVYLTPIWATLIGITFLSERLSIHRIASIIAALCGAWLILSSTNEHTLPLNMGDLAALVAGFIWAGALTCMKVFPRAPLSVSVWMNFVTGCLFTAVISLAIIQIDPPTFQVFRDTFSLALLTSLILLIPSMYIILWGARQVFPGRAGLLNMSEVVVAAASATLLLPEEAMALWQWVGAILIILGCIIEILIPTSNQQ